MQQQASRIILDKLWRIAVLLFFSTMIHFNLPTETMMTYLEGKDPLKQHKLREISYYIDTSHSIFMSSKQIIL